MSNTYVAAEMKRVIHWFTLKSTLWSSIWSYFCIDLTVNSKSNFLPIAASSTNSMIASPWICTSKVYKSYTVFQAHQCLQVQIHSHLPVNGKNNVHIEIYSMMWVEIEEREKLAVTEDWTQGLKPELPMIWPLSCNHQVITYSCNLLYVYVGTKHFRCTQLIWLKGNY